MTPIDRHLYRRRLPTTFLVASLLASLATFPVAAAHSCTAEEGDPNERDCRGSCTEGEWHNHKVTHHHENGIGEDELHEHYSCSSRGDDGGEGCVTPKILGICPIEKALRLLGSEVGLL